MGFQVEGGGFRAFGVWLGVGASCQARGGHVGCAEWGGGPALLRRPARRAACPPAPRRAAPSAASPTFITSVSRPVSQRFRSNSHIFWPPALGA
jgi:hypothetical protein